MITDQSNEILAPMNNTSSTNSSTNNNYDEYLTKTDAGLNIEANNIDVNCITSRNNKFNLDSDGNLTCNTITADIELGNAIVNNITSATNKFSMDAEGNLTCNSVTTVEQSGNDNLNFDSIYPIGSIYMSVNDANPSTLFTGTNWEKIVDEFLVGAGNKYALGSNGGTETHTHTSAAHTHNSGSLYAAVNFAGTYGTRYLTKTGIWFTPNERKADGGAGYGYSAGCNEGVQVLGEAGWTTPENTGASSNIPPYLAINIWKRVS